jgi:hypothetical protein
MSVNPNQTNANATTSFFAPASGGGGGGGSNFPNGAILGTSNGGGAVYGLSSMSCFYQTAQTGSNLWFPATYCLQPNNAALTDFMGIILRYDPLDAGQTALVLGSRGDGSAYLTGVWEGYISMPLEIAGATLSLVSDNETFMYMNGNAGALGTISTGTPFLSGSNLFSSIKAPNFASNANMSALLSTLATTYPACFS